MPTKDEMTNNSPKKEWWLKKKHVVYKTKQKEKVQTIGVLPCKAPRRWLFVKWC
jgi:hypothetical protein